MGGAARKQVQPRSRTQDERPVTREHNSFSRGMYRDMPASDIPEMGEADIFNFSNMGRYLETRTGSIEWGDHANGVAAEALPNELTGMDQTAGVEDSGLQGVNQYHISSSYEDSADMPSYMGSLEDDVLNWYIGVDYGDGLVYELILEYNYYGGGGAGVNFDVKTKSLGEHTLDTTTVRLVPPVKSIFSSEYHDCFLIHIGCSVYRSSDLFVSSWEKIRLFGEPSATGGGNYGWTQDISASLSKMVELEDRVAFFTDSGIYSINAEDGYFFQTNTAVPESVIENVKADEIDPQKPFDPELQYYGRKRVYSLGRLTGEGDRDRQTAGVFIEWESGGCLPDPESNYRDYGVQWFSSEAAAVSQAYSGAIRGLSPVSPNSQAPDSTQATHYMIYGTENIDPTTGIEALGNNPENLVWEIDIPISWIAVATFIVTDFENISTVTLTRPLPENLDYLAVEIDSDKIGILSDESGPVTIRTDDLYSVGDTAIVSYGLGDIQEVVSIASNIVTMNAFIDAQVGTLVHFSNGQSSRVKDSITATTFEVDDAINFSAGMVAGCRMTPVPVGDVDIAGTIYQAGFDSRVTDNTLYNRSDVYFMPNRFFEPMADGELGDIFGLFAFAGSRSSQTVEYCQIAKNFEYLFGQHNKPLQYHNLGDTATQISRFKGVMSVKCLASTTSFSLTAYTVGGNTGAARFVYIINTANEVSSTVGCVGPWAVTKIDGSNDEMVLTNEPGLRVFNGLTYGANMLKDRILDNLKSIGQNFAVSYSDEHGLIIWSTENDS